MELGDIKQTPVAFLGAGFAQPLVESRIPLCVDAGIVALPSKDPQGKAANSSTDVPGPRMPGQGNAAI